MDLMVDHLVGLEEMNPGITKTENVNKTMQYVKLLLLFRMQMFYPLILHVDFDPEESSFPSSKCQIVQLNIESSVELTFYLAPCSQI